MVPPTYSQKKSKKNQEKPKIRSPNESSMNLLPLHILAIISFYVMLYYIVPPTYSQKKSEKNQEKPKK